MIEHTSKNVNFISDPKLVEIARANLRELDAVIEVGAHKSTLFLAMSVVEGILPELIEQEDLAQLRALRQWPMNPQGSAKKTKSQLKVKERIAILSEIGRLPSGFEQTYGPLWDYRNQVHVEAALHQQKPISRSIAQLSVAALNALIEVNKPHRHFAEANWRVKRGTVQYVRKTGQFRIAIPADGYPAALTTERWKRSDVTINFVVHTPPGVLFGVLYNFESMNRFRLIRLDKRPGFGDAGLLSCNAWPHWRALYRFVKTPDASRETHEFKIKLSKSKELEVWVDGAELQVADNAGAKATWSYDPDKSLGLWVEQGACDFERLHAT